ncbi:MAG: penicillin-binding protein 1C [Prevotellaceae bacterium]|jgi:penicillin-binding protein 1C|nr:penicillin-binding protein 1C [Prevotellaceae bacterium]
MKQMSKLKRQLILAAYFVAAAFLCSPLDLPDAPYSTVIESADGELLGAAIASDGQWRFPPGDAPLPEAYCSALVTFEDKRFYSHQGVDPGAVVRALLRNLKSGKTVEGGSTLTMQTVRLMRRGRKRSVTEKIVEALTALKLEARMSKREILELYAANAPFGGNVVGIEAAAWRYFGRQAAELSHAEAAMLAVLPNAPALIHPARNRMALEKKRNFLLDKMAAKGLLDAESRDLAKAEPLPESPLPLPRAAPHLLDKIVAARGGQRTATTLSAQLQRAVTAVTENHVRGFKSNLVHNAAAIVAEVESGNVLAYVGNVVRDNSLHGGNVDVVSALRSTGSVLKPFLFAAMLDAGEILPGALVSDIPFHLAGFSPQNFNRSYDGAVAASEVLQRSLNVPSVRMLADYGVERFHLLLKDAGMTALDKPPMHYGLSLILGGAEGRLIDMAGMYADMARIVNRFAGNDGRYCPDDRKKLNYILRRAESAPDPAKSRRYSSTGLIGAAATYLTLETLSELNRPEEESSWMLFSSGRRIAWKTGTSYGNRDAWSIGVTPDYVVAAWVGNASGEGRPMLTGVSYAAPLMFELFNLLPHSGRRFEPPYDEMARIAVCRESGHRAGEHCAERDSVWVPEAGLETSVCPYHRLVHLDAEERFRVNSSCYPPHEMVHRSWFVLPPAQEWYYRRRHVSYRSLPPADPRCTLDETLPMQMIYPMRGVAVMPARQIDGRKGKIAMRAAHNRTGSTVYWHIDDQYIGETTDNHQLAYLPAPGAHRLTLIDDEGYSLEFPFEVLE